MYLHNTKPIDAESKWKYTAAGREAQGTRGCVHE